MVIALRSSQKQFCAKIFLKRRWNQFGVAVRVTKHPSTYHIFSFVGGEDCWELWRLSASLGRGPTHHDTQYNLRHDVFGIIMNGLVMVKMNRPALRLSKIWMRTSRSDQDATNTLYALPDGMIIVRALQFPKNVTLFALMPSLTYFDSMKVLNIHKNCPRQMKSKF